MPMSLKNTKYTNQVYPKCCRGKTLSDIQLSTLFGNLEVYDMLSRHDYLFVDEQIRVKLQKILEIRKLEKNDVENINIS